MRNLGDYATRTEQMENVQIKSHSNRWPIHSNGLIHKSKAKTAQDLCRLRRSQKTSSRTTAKAWKRRRCAGDPTSIVSLFTALPSCATLPQQQSKMMKLFTSILACFFFTQMAAGERALRFRYYKKMSSSMSSMSSMSMSKKSKKPSKLTLLCPLTSYLHLFSDNACDVSSTGTHYFCGSLRFCCSDGR